MRDVIVFLSAFVFGSYVVTILSPNGDAQIETLELGVSDLAVEVHKISEHPFSTDYDFKLVLKAGKEELDSVDMTSDTGGRGRIEVLKINSETIAFRDHWETECLNIPSEEFEDCGSINSEKRIGYFDFDSSKEMEIHTPRRSED